MAEIGFTKLKQASLATNIDIKTFFTMCYQKWGKNRKTKSVSFEFYSW